MSAAVAAAGPIGGPTPWWPSEGLTTSEPSPGECLRGVAASIVYAPKYVQFGLRRIVVIDRSRGVCGESDVGNKKLLAAVVAVSGAFATATVIPALAVKKRLHHT